MSIDLGSPALEIAVALSFVFFLLSLIVSALAERVTGVLKLRAKTLKKGIEGMLGDEGVAADLLAHPLVRTELEPQKKWIGYGTKKERGPSYVSAGNFALAFLDVVFKKTASPSSDLAQKTGSGPVLSTNLERQVTALEDGAGDTVQPFRKSVEEWFDASMERVTGWYTRQTRLITIALAALVVVGLNASALRIVDRLEAEPAVRAAVVATAEAAVEDESASDETEDEGAPGEAGGEGAPAGAGGESAPAGAEDKKQKEKEAEEALLKPAKDVEGAYSQLAALQLPILWADENSAFGHGVPVFAEALVGWLITIIAISLGAPFWFDALGKLSNLRSAGKKPEPQSDSK